MCMHKHVHVCIRILFSSLVHLHDRIEHSLLIESVSVYVRNLHDHMLFNYPYQDLLHIGTWNIHVHVHVYKWVIIKTPILIALSLP